MAFTPSITLQQQTIRFDPEVYTWKPLRLLGIYRVFLGLCLLVIYFGRIAPHLLGGRDPQLFVLTATGYLLASGLLLLLYWWRRPFFDTQVYLHTYLDLFALLLLMHASGGVESGLGMLLLVTITAAGVLMPGRIALWFAALASLGILSEQLYLQLSLGPAATSYPQAGILGATLFVTAGLSALLTRRGRENAELAELRAHDLENLAELNELIVEQMDVGVLVIDGKQRIRLANGSARAALRLPDISAMPPLVVCAPRLAYALQVWQAAPESGPPSIKEPHSQAELQPQFVALGNRGLLVFLEDRSLLSQQVQQLKLASLGRLTASIAHEIRNPLGAISHAAQLLHESPQLDATDRRFSEIISEQCKRMNRIIEDVLQLSRGGNVKAERLDLVTELPQIRRQYLQSAHSPEELLQLDLSAQTSAPVYVDPSHLRQVLWNLWRNAALHGAGGDAERAVTVTTRISNDPATGHVVMDVQDDGCGIPQALVAEIFEPFVTSGNKGTGLGLFLARELCEFNNASLSYRPSAAGSCFRISFNPQPRQ